MFLMDKSSENKSKNAWSEKCLMRIFLFISPLGTDYRCSDGIGSERFKHIRGVVLTNKNHYLCASINNYHY